MTGSGNGCGSIPAKRRYTAIMIAPIAASGRAGSGGHPEPLSHAVDADALSPGLPAKQLQRAVDQLSFRPAAATSR